MRFKISHLQFTQILSNSLKLCQHVDSVSGWSCKAGRVQARNKTKA